MVMALIALMELFSMGSFSLEAQNLEVLLLLAARLHRGELLLERWTQKSACLHLKIFEDIFEFLLHPVKVLHGEDLNLNIVDSHHRKLSLELDLVWVPILHVDAEGPC